MDTLTRAFGAAILIAGLIAGSAAAEEQGAAPVERR
ncbi:MAG: hypothetical protein HW409_1358, partial [candidate division NC10 bacterium]|nr:hypothetical protein [candidate division NC10 bacterium]